VKAPRPPFAEAYIVPVSVNIVKSRIEVPALLKWNTPPSPELHLEFVTVSVFECRIALLPVT
jgi:hypothetical protein